MALPRVRAGSGAIVAAVGTAVLSLLLAVWLLVAGMRTALRESSLDSLLPLVVAAAANPDAPEVIVVDIDRDSLSLFGSWPWPRARLAQLVATVAAAAPRVVAVDMLLAEPDRLSPAALARALAATTGRSDIADLAGVFPDGDTAFADALAAVPAVLGFALDPEGAAAPLPPTPILLRGAASLPAIWQAPGLVPPTRAVAAGAQSFGALALAADPDGLVRRVPLLVFVGGKARPGLAVETIRLAEDAGALVIGPGPVMGIGEITTPLEPDAALRLVPRPADWWATHRISAAALHQDPLLAQSLAGRVVLIGGSAPELGGLRGTPSSAVTPSVLIQATAIDTLLRGPLLRRPAWLANAEIGGVLLLGVLGLAAAARLRPLRASALMASACVLWFLCTAWAARGAHLLADPVGPPMIAAGAFGAALLARFIREEWQAQRLRASFEQHLAPAVVRRISADPRALRLQGELREITAFFTDIDGFTGMTERAEPTDLVALLDAYFDMASRLVTAHGGMIEKIVGDAVHAIFNAPFELDDHPGRAVDCALALHAESEVVRRSQLGQKLQLGRTRIGIETGMAIVGDIGGSRKLDYTAHGTVMNTAARLEVANKDLGSWICIGPGTAARLRRVELRSMGTVTPRGLESPIEVFTPAALR